jgi:hypothetical protein
VKEEPTISLDETKLEASVVEIQILKSPRLNSSRSKPSKAPLPAAPSMPGLQKKKTILDSMKEDV